jgi:hypothetical protein
VKEEGHFMPNFGEKIKEGRKYGQKMVDRYKVLKEPPVFNARLESVGSDNLLFSEIFSTNIFT